MKHWRRILFNAIVVQSLLLVVVTTVLWVRSYGVSDMLSWIHQKFYLSKNYELTATTVIHANTGNGEFELLIGSALDFGPMTITRPLPFCSNDFGLETEHRPSTPRRPMDISWCWGDFGVGSDYDNNVAVYSLRFPAWSAFVLWLVLPSVWLVRRWREARKKGGASLESGGS